MDTDLTLTQAAMRLGLSYTQALRRVLIGELDGRQQGGRWRVTARSVERYLAMVSGVAPYEGRHQE